MLSSETKADVKPQDSPLQEEIRKLEENRVNNEDKPWLAKINKFAGYLLRQIKVSNSEYLIRAIRFVNVVYAESPDSPFFQSFFNKRIPVFQGLKEAQIERYIYLVQELSEFKALLNNNNQLNESVIKQVMAAKYLEMEKIYDDKGILDFINFLENFTQIMANLNELNDSSINSFPEDHPATLACKTVYTSISAIIFLMLQKNSHDLRNDEIDFVKAILQDILHLIQCHDLIPSEPYITALVDYAKIASAKSGNWNSLASALLLFTKAIPQGTFQTVPLEVTSVKYTPAQVILSDLHENHKLYSDDQIKLITQAPLKKGRNKKSELQLMGIEAAKWDVIKVAINQHYAVYRGKKDNGHLGKGSHGFTKLALHLETGDWVVIKIIRRKIFNKDNCIKEISGLNISSQYIYNQFRNNKKGEMQFEILMKLAPGIELYDFLFVKRKAMADICWLDLCILMAESINQLHMKKVVHGDFNIANCLFHLSTWSATLVDFGSSLFLEENENERMCEDRIYGNTITYQMAPETARGLIGYKADIYSLGIMLALVLDLGYAREESKQFILHSTTGHKAKPSTKVPSINIGRDLSMFVAKMLSDTPAVRPTALETVTFLQTIRKQYTEQSSLFIHTAYLDLNDWINANDHHKKKMINLMKQSDEVYLVDTNRTNANRYSLHIRELEQSQITVMYSVIQAPAKRMVKKAVDMHMQLRQRRESCEYGAILISKSCMNGEKLFVPMPTVPHTTEEQKAEHRSFALGRAFK